MNEEFETELNGEPVTVCFEVDGYKPLGLWIMDSHGDITDTVSEADYDRLYQQACTHVVESMADAADMVAGMER